MYPPITTPKVLKHYQIEFPIDHIFSPIDHLSLGRVKRLKTGSNLELGVLPDERSFILPELDQCRLGMWQKAEM